ncbi:MAG: hypothetical protein N5P05_002344 [Chroococcopsis gigantea SAG 12.99]|jgi:uncharacterized lipoprotein YddW (UPF0748 family)|nr:family 10 glycosylhydrolase [Chlorogloea purpurea SAG 13.99]MDV3000738.1 hypothetical protein [Chroococcopsis gigantea SAG 12.99]
MSRKSIVSILSPYLPLLFLTSVSTPVYSLPESAPVGIIRTPENSNQWKDIASRFQALGFNYCFIDSNGWTREEDLKNVSVLLLPNVETIKGSQIAALDRWLDKGGKVIVTGPTGTLSEPAVKNQLRSLLGAYWGFSNSDAYSIKPVTMSGPNIKSLSSNLRGGVVIPTGVNSQTAAVWGARGNPPAVVITATSTFLGWRWGVDTVSPPAFDRAWLEMTLNRYGVRPALAGPSAGPCNNSSLALNNKPLPPRVTAKPKTTTPPVMPPSPPVTVNSPVTTVRETSNGKGLSGKEIQEMTDELGGLIARFESTLIAAEARGANLNTSTKTSGQETVPTSASKNSAPPFTANKRLFDAVNEAKNGLKQFQELTQQNRYEEARQVWLQTRRNLWDNYPTDRSFAQSEVRAMWLDRGTIVKAKSEADLAQVFDRMATAGINVVFFETVNASYTIYPSRVAPEQNPLTKGWDPLKAAVKLAHERGMEIHAWVWAFAAANQGHNGILNQPKDYLGPVLSRNPDWGSFTRHGSPFDYGRQYKKAFFDPANPEVQKYLISLYEEIVTNYAVDGLQLDYIRYPFQDPKVNETYGYGKSARFLFKEMTGVDPVDIDPGDPLWDQWTTFRIRQIDNFVANVSRTLKQKRPDLMLSVAVFPIERRERLLRLQQNWEEWGQNNWIDMVFLMTYALDTGSLEDRTKYAFQSNAAGASLVIPGIRLLKVPDLIAFDQLQLIRSMPTSGFALFAAENFNNSPNLQGILNRTQGAIDPRSLDPIPYRQPFKAASFRFQSLQMEWTFLQMTGGLKIDEVNVKAWQQQIETVENLLAQLAANPTPDLLTRTRTALDRLQRQFGFWMTGHQQTSPYQVRAWQNRLQMLERLLVYGDRLTFGANNNLLTTSGR